MLIKYFKIIFSLLLIIGLTSGPGFALGSNYRVKPEDVLQITVYEHDDLKTKVRVSSDGDISFPLLDKVKVADLTIGEIEMMLTVALEKDYLVSAQVQVFIEDYHSKQITILGAVENPGKYDMNAEKETTILEVIALSGGFSDVANVNKVRIIRAQDEETEYIPIRISDITKGNKEKDVVLKNGDVIFVPESFF